MTPKPFLPMTSNLILRDNLAHVPLVGINSSSGVSPRRYIASDNSHRASSPTLRSEEGLCSKFNHGFVDSPSGEIRSIWVAVVIGLIVALTVHHLNHEFRKYPAPNYLVTLLYMEGRGLFCLCSKGIQIGRKGTPSEIRKRRPD